MHEQKPDEQDQLDFIRGMVGGNAQPQKILVGPDGTFHGGKPKTAEERYQDEMRFLTAGGSDPHGRERLRRLFGRLGR
jgi:hypothetical protein